jgi:hypothetical protein
MLPGDINEEYKRHDSSATMVRVFVNAHNRCLNSVFTHRTSRHHYYDDRDRYDRD